MRIIVMTINSLWGEIFTKKTENNFLTIKMVYKSYRSLLW